MTRVSRTQLSPQVSKHIPRFYVYGYLNRIKAGVANFANGASEDAIDLSNHLHRCLFNRSFITA